MTSDTDTDTDALRTAREFAESTGKEDLADRLDGKINDQIEAAQTVAQMRTLAQNGEQAGLEGDPAIEALKEEAAALAEEYDLTEEPSAKEKLVDEHGLRERSVKRMHDDDREQLLEALGSIETISEENSRLDGVMRKEAEVRRDEIEKLIDHNNLTTSKLIGDESADLQAALAGDQSPTVDESKSDRVKAAELADEKERLQDDLDDAESALLELELIEEIERIDERIGDLEA
jgi:hypothetical protein